MTLKMPSRGESDRFTLVLNVQTFRDLLSVMGRKFVIDDRLNDRDPPLTNKRYG